MGKSLRWPLAALIVLSCITMAGTWLAYGAGLMK